MPFSLGQIFGGWKRKGNAKKTTRFSDENSRRGRAGANTDLNLKSKAPRDKEFSDENRAVASSTPKTKSSLAWQTIVAPHISEKGGFSGESGYIFKVANGANKSTIRRALEERYGVKVDSVRVINAPSKPRRRGQVIGEKPGFKKAVISLKEGQSITDF